MAQDVQGMLIRIEATTSQLRKELAAADRAVSGSTSKIDKELSLVDKAFDRMGLNAEQSRKAIGSAMAGITAAAAGGVAGLGALVVSTANSAREIQNLSQVANASTTEFQRYAVGAKTVGVEQEKLADILKDVNDRVGDFLSTGGGEMKDFFENIAPKVGVTAEQFRKLSGPQSLQLFYSSLEKANLSQAEMTFYMESMADETTALIPLLRDGGAGFSAMADEAERLGLVMSEKTLKQFDQFNAQMDTAKIAAGGFGTQIATEALPALSELNGLLLEFAQDSDAASVVGDALGVVLKGVATVAIGLSTTFANLGRAIGGLAAAASAAASMEFAQASSIIDEFTADNERATAETEQRIKKLWTGEYAEAGKRAVEVNRSVSESSVQLGAAAKKAVEEQNKAVADRLKAIDALVAKYDPATKALEDYQKGIELADAALLDGTYTTEQYQAVVQGLYTELNKPTWDKYNKEAEETAKTLKQLEDETQAIIDRLDPAGKAARDYAAEQKRLNEALVEFPGRADEIRAALGKLGEEYEANQRELTAWGRLTDAAVERVDEAFADAWKNIDQGFDGFADGLKDGFKQLLAELAHEAITKPIVISFANQLLGTSKPGGISDVWGSMFGGGTPAAGGTSGGLGGALQAANQARSLYSMYGTAQTLLPILQGGYASGGFGGALGALGSYAGSFLGGSGAAASMAAGSTAAGYGGAGYASWVAAQGAGGAAAGAGGIGAGINGALSSAASMWWLAPLLGMYQSAKLWDDGVRISGRDTAKLNIGSQGAAGDVAWAPFTAGSYAVEWMDKSLATVVDPLNLFGDKADKLVAVLTGSPVTQAVTNFLGKGLFGGEWETKNYGLTAEVANGGFGSFSYQYQKKDGGWFGGDKKRTTYKPIEQETNQALNDTYDAVESGVADLFGRLSLEVTDAALAGINIARTNISTKGKTDEEIQAAIGEWFTKAGESINTQLNAALGTGLELDLAGMQAFIGNLEGINALFDQLSLSLYDSTVAGGKMAEELSAVAGGFDVLAANTATYYDGYYSAEEKTANTLEAITKAFADADVELVRSRDDYRAMVESVDRTTEAGREMFATMMALSDEAAAYVAILDQQAAAAAQALGVAVDGAYASLQRSIAAQQKDLQADYNARAAALNATAAGATANVSALTGVSNSLSAALTRLRGTSSDAVRMLRAQALATLQGALATAQAGGSLAGLDGLQDALDVSASMDASLYASLEDFEREQGRTANLIAELERLNGKQLSAEQQLLDTTKAQLEQAKQQFEQQMEGLNVQLAFAQSQLDALNGVDNSVKSVAEAIHAMSLAVVAALSAMGGDTGKNATPANVATLADSVYRGVLGRDADAAGLAYWQGQVSSGALTLDQLPDAIRNAAVANGEIPAFATGGFHSGGAFVAGEIGPELVVTGPARIYNANQTASMLNGGGSDAAAEEVRALRGEVRFLSQALSAIQYATEETRKALRTQNEVGVPTWSG